MMISRRARPTVGVRALAGAEYIVLTIDAEPLPDWPVHNDDSSLPGGALQQAGDHSGTAGEGVHCCDYHREVFRLAARHDRINRGLSHSEGRRRAFLH